MTHAATLKQPTTTRTAWGGVVVMMATSLVLVVAEFLPPSLLPSMAASLGISEGQAGQAVTATALVGLVTAPTIGMLFPRLERRTLLSLLAVAATVSNVAVAVSPNLVTLLIARLLLGAAIGGFWAMSLAVAARLSAPEHVGRAVMLVNTGTTLATVAGVPLGIYLGSIYDWRTVFGGVAVVTLIVAVALRVVLPPVPPAATTGFRVLGETMRTPGLGRGLTGHVLTVLGHFAAFTYIRAALARTPELNEAGVAWLVIVFGFGGFVGNLVVGSLVDRHLRLLRFLVPFGIGAGIGGLALFPGQIWLVGVLVALWGFAFGSWLTVAATWIARAVPARMEVGGGLLVAGFQLAISVGAALGGLLVDGAGVGPALGVAAVCAVVGGLLFGTAKQRVPELGDRG
ncbi:MFS transporter [Nakamurella silvestris]|nr:MFS transporter [Nakamurella silvestris]